jgi:glycosyltransferase involved in cell wall biosynthesis
MKRLSIIIPVLDEAERIGGLLAALQAWREQGVEVIVADGGSRDGTPGLCVGLADQVIASARGRAAQMNAGAATSHGDVLFFLHADTMPPADSHRRPSRRQSPAAPIGAASTFASTAPIPCCGWSSG